MTLKRWKTLSFLAVFERHKSGWPHLHILLRCGYIAQQQLSLLSRAYIGSPVVDIRRIDSGRHAARYIAKYVSKDNIRFETCKRYWKSKDYDKAKEDENKHEIKERLDWYASRSRICSIARSLEEEGWIVKWKPDGSATARAPPALLQQAGISVCA
jgi:hypothetical protein